jgi:hypothetical protein
MISAAFAALFLQISDTNRTPDVETFGIGSQTCAYWRSNVPREHEGEAWLLGYWSGFNRLNTNSGIVGSRAEGPGIIGEVAKVCASNTNLTLEDATFAAYVNLQTAKR